MGNIGPDVCSALAAHGLKVSVMDFPQNVHRDEFGYRRLLMKTVAACRPRMIMPVGNPVTLSRIAAEAAAGESPRNFPGIWDGIVFAVESPGKVMLLDSKVSSSALATRLGIRQPAIYATPEEAEGRQVIFKRDVSFGGQGVHLPWNRRSLDNLIAHQSPGEPYLIEDFIKGDDYSVDVLRFPGFVRTGCYKVVAHHPATRGAGGDRGSMCPSTGREMCSFPEIEQMALRILDELDYNGVCGMDFRVDAGGVPYFLECNPRFTAAVGSQVEAGFDIPYLLYSCLNQQSRDFCEFSQY